MNRFLRLMLMIAVLFVCLSLAVPLAAQESTPEPVGLRPDAPTYAVHGPYWVGVRDFIIEDKEGKRPLPVAVWYPALNDSGAENYAVYDMGISDLPDLKDASLISDGHALADAAPAMTGAPYALVVISPGLGGSRYSYYRLSEHLASYGFVVIGIEHIGTAVRDLVQGLADVASENDIQSLYYRPSDIVRTTRYADTLTKAGGSLSGLIDTDRIAVLGHSTGGTTALQAGGAHVEFQALKTWCADKASEEGAVESCQFLGHEDELAGLYKANDPKTGILPALWDRRVDAVVTYAPGGELHVFGDNGIAAVQVPTLVMFGTADPFVTPKYNASWAYDKISSPDKALVTFQNGGHLMFLDCPASWKDACGYDAVWETARVRDLTDHLTTAFLLDVLKGDKDAHKALLPDAVKFPGIDYQTTMQ